MVGDFELEQGNMYVGLLSQTKLNMTYNATSATSR